MEREVSSVTKRESTGTGAVSEDAAAVIETAIELVEAGVECVEDLLQRRFHGAASTIEPGVVVVRSWGRRRRGGGVRMARIWERDVQYQLLAPGLCREERKNRKE